MDFSKKLRKAMEELGITQTQVVCMTGLAKSCISQYLSGKNVPTEERMQEMASSLGLRADYFSDERFNYATLKKAKIPRLLPMDAARVMGMSYDSVASGLQQGVFPWGYGIVTSEDPKTGKKRWTYFINAKRFAEVEGIDI